MGDGLTAKTTEWQMWNRIRPVSKEQIRLVAAGENPGAVNVDSFIKGAKVSKGPASFLQLLASAIVLSYFPKWSLMVN